MKDKGEVVHADDVERARLEVKKPTTGWGPMKPGPVARFFWYSARHGGLRIPPVGEVTTYADGDVLEWVHERTRRRPGDTAGPRVLG